MGERERVGKDTQGCTVGDQQAETKWSNGAEMGNLWDRYGGPKSMSPPFFILGSNTSEHRAELLLTPYFKHHSSSQCTTE